MLNYPSGRWRQDLLSNSEDSIVEIFFPRVIKSLKDVSKFLGYPNCVKACKLLAFLFSPYEAGIGTTRTSGHYGVYSK